MEEVNIKSLSVREQCRDKLSIFYGSRDNYYHGLIEVLMNSNDEVTNNFEEGYVKVTVYDDLETLEVFDSGRGIPLMGETNGVENYKLLFETIFAGTNYENLEKGKVSTGTNGCGATVLNYTSELYEVTSYKEGVAYTVKYSDGGEFKGYFTYPCENDKHGTNVKFKLDKLVYTKTKYDIDEIKGIVNRLAGTSNKVKFIVEYNGETTEYAYENPLEYMQENTANSLTEMLVFQPKKYVNEVSKEGETLEEENTIEAIISLSTEPFQQTFLNSTYLKENGAIYNGIIEGLKKAFSKELKKAKLTNQDVEMSFNIYCSVSSTNVEFSNQTKFSTNKALYKQLTSSYIADNMLILKTEKPKLFETMLKHLTTINTLNEKTEKGRSAIKKQLEERVSSIATRPKKLVPCRSKNPNEVELILIEGDSAMNSVKLGRDPNTMMVYPLKGKPINPLKKSIDAILSNDEIVDVFKIIGCGITYKGKNVKGFPPFNIDNLNVSKIVIATDFDEDGFHIQSLLIGIFYMLAPQLLVENKIEFVKTPLYSIKQKGEEYFAYSEMDRHNILKEIAKNGSYKETRWKGLGSIPTSTMSTCLNKETRISTVVTMEDAKKCAEMIELFLSDDIEKRKEYIEKYGHEYVTESMLV